MTSDAVLVLPEEVLPQSALPAMRPDPLLLARGLPLGWLSRNAVTGELASAPAPVLWPRTALAAHLGGEPAPAAAVLPHCAADWSFNHDPARTLAKGFASAAARRAAAEGDPEAAARLAAHASLGADAAHGHFWIIGACHALLAERTLAECQALELATPPTRRPPRGAPATSPGRCAAGPAFNVIALTPEASRLMKAIRFRMPPRAVYADLAAIYDTLGPEGAAMAARYRRAADWLWGTATPARPRIDPARTRTPAPRKAALPL